MQHGEYFPVIHALTQTGIEIGVLSKLPVGFVNADVAVNKFSAVIQINASFYCRQIPVVVMVNRRQPLPAEIQGGEPIPMVHDYPRKGKKQ